jgi:putative hemolysin
MKIITEKNSMKYCFAALAAMLLAGCTTGSNSPQSNESQVGMANPASVWCKEKGGVQVPIQSPQGVRTDCKLPNGEVLDEWALWRRDHPQ